MRKRLVVAAGLTGLLLGATAVPAAAAPKAPGKPGSVTVQSGTKSYTVRWKAAPTHGTKVTGYQVADRVKKGKKWSRWTFTKKKRSARSATIKGKNGSLHQVKVRAKSAKGYGKFSKPKSIRVGLPGTPGSVLATKGSSKVAASWTAAAAHGKAITSYRVYTRYKSGSGYSGWSSRTAPASAKSLTVTGLSNARTYQVKVRAVNKNGVGPASAIRTATAPRMSVTPSTGPFVGGEKVTVGFAGFPYGETTLNVAVCANDGRPLSGPTDCAPLGGASNKLVTPSKGSGSATLTVPDGALGNTTGAPITCGSSGNCAIVVTTVTSNFFMAGPVVLKYVNPTMSAASGPYVGGESVAVSFSGFPVSETTLNVAVCANDGRMLSGPGDCAPLGGASNKLVTPAGGAGSVSLTVPAGALGNTGGAPITCDETENCAIVVTTITSNFYLAGPIALKYVDPTMTVSSGPYTGGDTVTVDFSGFPVSETTLNVAVCANDGRMLSGPGDCAPLGGDSNKLVTPTAGAGSVNLTLPDGALGNTNGAPITCGAPDSCAIVVTTITSNFFMAGPVAFTYVT